MQRNRTTLWKAFHDEGNLDARASIIEQNLPLVQHIARQIKRKVGLYVSLDDLVNAGCVGLVHAVDTFDSSRGPTFSTHAVPRIRGAIIDDIRRTDAASRAVRRRQRSVRDTEQQLTGRLGRRPTHRETACALDIDTETLWKWKAAVRKTSTLSLDHPVAVADGDGPALGERIPAANGEEIDERLTTAREINVLEDEIRHLTERERIVLMLYYHEEMNLRQIADVLGLTESRISQIRTKAIGTLRGRLAHLREDA